MNLPVELISLILSPLLAVSDDKFTDTSRVSPFAAYSASTSSYLLVCQQWRRVLERDLYQTVVIRSPAQAKALQDTLKAKPWLGKHVRKFRLEGWYGTYASKALGMCPNVTDLWIPISLWSDEKDTGFKAALSAINPRRACFHEEWLLCRRSVPKVQDRARALLISIIPSWTNLRAVQHSTPHGYGFLKQILPVLSRTDVETVYMKDETRCGPKFQLTTLPEYHPLLAKLSKLKVVRFNLSRSLLESMWTNNVRWESVITDKVFFNKLVFDETASPVPTTQTQAVSLAPRVELPRHERHESGEDLVPRTRSPLAEIPATSTNRPDPVKNRKAPSAPRLRKASAAAEVREVFLDISQLVAADTYKPDPSAFAAAQGLVRNYHNLTIVANAAARDYPAIFTSSGSSANMHFRTQRPGLTWETFRVLARNGSDLVVLHVALGSEPPDDPRDGSERVPSTEEFVAALAKFPQLESLVLDTHRPLDDKNCPLSESPNVPKRALSSLHSLGIVSWPTESWANLLWHLTHMRLPNLRRLDIPSADLVAGSEDLRRFLQVHGKKLTTIQMPGRIDRFLIRLCPNVTEWIVPHEHKDTMMFDINRLFKHPPGIPNLPITKLERIRFSTADLRIEIFEGLLDLDFKTWLPHLREIQIDEPELWPKDQCVQPFAL